ncbi:hypothetical protein SCOR_27485 [Sulfidibacter corallicola]|uniref:Uncharacterized protein n=1 Tax=Sulfidibacter corallicola TaxID=2818388 RepID=A0A8A4TP74_SULCO|nr:hypothetical protein [Sulfidibacter corallicola]QTD50701.1 hypothetical protein J3U87_34375 [Sulfidibacter corallicola]
MTDRSKPGPSEPIWIIWNLLEQLEEIHRLIWALYEEPLMELMNLPEDPTQFTE